MHIVNNIVLCMLKFVKKIDLILSALATKKNTARGHRKSFGDGGNIYYLDCGDGIISVSLCPNSSNCVH